MLKNVLYHQGTFFAWKLPVEQFVHTKELIMAGVDKENILRKNKAIMTSAQDSLLSFASGPKSIKNQSRKGPHPHQSNWTELEGPNRNMIQEFSYYKIQIALE